MNTFVVGLMITASFALADDLPEGSEQYEAFYRLANEIGAPVECPPQLQLEGVQSGCALYRGEASDFANVIDDAINTQDIPLGAVDRVWSYDADFKRYGRSFSLLQGGAFRVIYDVNDGQVPNVTIFFTP